MGATPGRNIAPTRRTPTLNRCEFDHDSDLVHRLGNKMFKTPSLKDFKTWTIRLYRLAQLLSLDLRGNVATQRCIQVRPVLVVVFPISWATTS